jgi:topoisomerase IA-like protein
MLFENYRELVTERAAQEYFGILPEKKCSKSKSKGARKTTAKGAAKLFKKTAGKSTK